MKDCELDTDLAFHGLRVDVRARIALAGGQPISLGDRAFDILSVLLAAEKNTASKVDIYSAVWGEGIVEENRLRVHISALRAAIASVAKLEVVRGVGYRLARVDALSLPSGNPGNLPIQASELIGRDEARAQVVALSGQHRVVTLVGAGGIGKTRLAIAVATSLNDQFSDGTWLVQLSAITEPHLVAQTVATTLRLHLAPGAKIDADLVAGTLSRHALLLVLDNCEHLSNAVAELLRRVIALAPGVRTLTTSRELLGTSEEVIYQVETLSSPLMGEDHSGEALLQLSAVALFVARVTQALYHYDPDAAELRNIGSICRHLDGIPLGIELAAARAAVLGVSEVLARFDARFAMLTNGRRTAVARHQTLSASFDWSYDLLSDSARSVLRYLSVFASDFTREAACRVAMTEAISTADAEESIDELVKKSLLQSRLDSGLERYSLFKATKHYALRLLNEQGESQSAKRRHAVWHRDLAVETRRAWSQNPYLFQVSSVGCRIEDIRGALNWAGSPDGDAHINVELTLGSEVFWNELRLLRECFGYLEIALQDLATLTEVDKHTTIRLYIDHGRYSFACSSPASSIDSTQRAVCLAAKIDDVEGGLVALRQLFSLHYACGDTAALADIAERFAALATRSAVTSDVYVAERLMAQAIHYRGQHVEARRGLQHMLHHYVAPPNDIDLLRFGIGQRVSSLALLACVHWVEGAFSQALQVASDGVAEATGPNPLASRTPDAAPLRLLHGQVSVTQMLTTAACPLAFISGNSVVAEQYVGIFEQSIPGKRHDHYSAWVDFYRALLRVRTSGVEGSEPELIASYRHLRKFVRLNSLTFVIVAFVEALSDMAEVPTLLAEVDQTIELMRNTGEVWCIPELLRLKGTVLLRLGGVDRDDQAGISFIEALKEADIQEAHGWAFFAAFSLARLRVTQQRYLEAIDLLSIRLDRLNYGSEIAAVREATDLLTVAHTAARAEQKELVEPRIASRAV